MILGAIVGDVVGSIYEFDNIITVDFPLLKPESTFTDDSVMTLAVANALLDAFEGRKPISDALVDSMRDLGNGYPGRGYGGNFNSWLHSRAEHPGPYNSWGNGAAMRVSPAGWVCDTIEAVDIVAAETAKVTHNHLEGIRGAQATAACILLARQSKGNDEIRAVVQERYGYALDFTLDEIRPRYSQSFDVSCQGSVPQAIEAFLESTGFEDAVRKAVSIGGDSDTISAITASIAQGRYGVPAEIEVPVKARLTSDLIAINDYFCQLYDVK